MPGSYSTSAATFNPILSSTQQSSLVPSYDTELSPKVDESYYGFEVVPKDDNTQISNEYTTAPVSDMHIDDDL